jgi:S-adenosylmethionine hydrolase
MGIITLLTDFGSQDEFVGVMKGVILARYPTVQLVDLCHQIAPHDVLQAAHMLAAAYRYFPDGTLHVAVVDPGVGGARRILYAEAARQQFLAPDNGLLDIVARRAPVQHLRAVTCADLFLTHVGHTFHGRDIFAPVAAHLAAGGDPVRVGPECRPTDMRGLTTAEPCMSAAGAIHGQVVHCDRFGNLVTDVDRALLQRMLGADLYQPLRIRLNREIELPLVPAFASVPTGAPLAVIGSRATLEIAVNQGRACDLLRAAVGTPLRIARAAAEEPGENQSP